MINRKKDAKNQASDRDLNETFPPFISNTLQYGAVIHRITCFKTIENKLVFIETMNIINILLIYNSNIYISLASSTQILR